MDSGEDFDLIERGALEHYFLLGQNQLPLVLLRVRGLLALRC